MATSDSEMSVKVSNLLDCSVLDWLLIQFGSYTLTYEVSTMNNHANLYQSRCN
jgi:hypothetical protein